MLDEHTLLSRVLQACWTSLTTAKRLGIGLLQDSELSMTEALPRIHCDLSVSQITLRFNACANYKRLLHGYSRAAYPTHDYYVQF